MEKAFFLKFFVLLFFILLVEDVLSKRLHRLSRASDNINVSGKIVGGYKVNIEDVPYQVFLSLHTDNGYYQCGGSIISERYILTAAHCLKGVSQIYIRAGSTLAHSGGTLYNTTRYKLHPFYNRINNDYDVALINIPDGIVLDGQTTSAVQLPTDGATITPGSNILVSGWGHTTENGKSSENLTAVEVSTISNNECRKSYVMLTCRQFCAGLSTGGKDACQGDSGSPAVATDSELQLGIVSYGKGCARPDYPGVYTNIATVRSWIKINSGV